MGFRDWLMIYIPEIAVFVVLAIIITVLVFNQHPDEEKLCSNLNIEECPHIGYVAVEGIACNDTIVVGEYEYCKIENIVIS